MQPPASKSDAVSAPARRDDFLAGICVALQCVAASTDGVLWTEIVRTAGEDDLLHYAACVEPEEWELAGFRMFARRELRRSKPRPKPRNPVLAAESPVA